MRRVIVSEFVSLNGVVEEPSWSIQFGSEEQDKFKFDELAASDTLLLGRAYDLPRRSWQRETPVR
jgi:hypothetical protein